MTAVRHTPDQRGKADHQSRKFDVWTASLIDSVCWQFHVRRAGGDRFRRRCKHY